MQVYTHTHTLTPSALTYAHMHTHMHTQTHIDYPTYYALLMKVQQKITLGNHVNAAVSAKMLITSNCGHIS